MQELEEKNGQLLEQRLAQTRAESEASRLRSEMDQLQEASRPSLQTPGRGTMDRALSQKGEAGSGQHVCEEEEELFV